MRLSLTIIKFNTIVILICQIILFNFNLYSQEHNKYSLGVGIDYIALDLPDDLVFSPNINGGLGLHPKWFVTSALGIIHHIHNDHHFPSVPNSRKRITIDLSLKYMPFRIGLFFLNLGAGLSPWHINDHTTQQLRIHTDTISNQIIVDKYYLLHTKTWKVGYNIFSELGVRILKDINLLSQFKVINHGKYGFHSVLGIKLVFCFK